MGPPLLTITLACVPLVPGTGLCYVVLHADSHPICVQHNLQMQGVTQDDIHQVLFRQIAWLHIVFPCFPHIFVYFLYSRQLPDAEFSTGSVWALRVNRIRQKSHIGRPRSHRFQNWQGMVRWFNTWKKQETMDLKLWWCSFLAEAQLEVLKTSNQIYVPDFVVYSPNLLQVVPRFSHAICKHFTEVGEWWMEQPQTISNGSLVRLMPPKPTLVLPTYHCHFI